MKKITKLSTLVIAVFLLTFPSLALVAEAQLTGKRVGVWLASSQTGPSAEWFVNNYFYPDNTNYRRFTTAQLFARAYYLPDVTRTVDIVSLVDSDPNIRISVIFSWDLAVESQWTQVANALDSLVGHPSIGWVGISGEHSTFNGPTGIPSSDIESSSLGRKWNDGTLSQTQLAALYDRFNSMATSRGFQILHYYITFGEITWRNTGEEKIEVVSWPAWPENLTGNLSYKISDLDLGTTANVHGIAGGLSTSAFNAWTPQAVDIYIQKASEKSDDNRHLVLFETGAYQGIDDWIRPEFRDALTKALDTYTPNVWIKPQSNINNNQSPTVTATSTPSSGQAPLTVNFTSQANDPDGSIVAYSWNFGDGIGTSNVQNPSYTYNTAGTFTASLTVTDNGGAQASTTLSITVTQPTITATTYPSDGDSWTESLAGWTSAGGNLVLSNDKVTGTYSITLTNPVPSQWVHFERLVNVSRLNNSAKLFFWHKGANIQWSLSDQYKNFGFFFNKCNLKSGWTGQNANWTLIQVDLSDIPMIDPNGEDEETYPGDCDNFADIEGIIFGAYNAQGFAIDGLYFSQESGISGDNIPPVISNVSVSNILSNSVQISWLTNEPATSQIEYGSAQNYGQVSRIDNSLATNHLFTLTNLQSDTLYYYRVLSIDSSANQAIGPGSTFRTIANLSPIAEAGNNQTIYLAGQAKFDGSLSRDADGRIISYAWNFGDGESGSGVTTSHIYNILGIYTVTLTITDDKGANATDTTLVYVISPPNGNLAGLPLGMTYSEWQDTYRGGTWGLEATFYWERDTGLSFETLAKDYLLANNIRDILSEGLRGDSWDQGLGDKLAILQQYGINVRFLFPLTGYSNEWAWGYFAQQSTQKYPQALSINALGGTNYGSGFKILDPTYSQYKDAFKEFVLYRYWNQFKNYPNWIGWQRSADFPNLPGEPYGEGFGLSDESLTKFVESEFFQVERIGDYNYLGRKGSETTGTHPDGTPCILYQIYVQGSRSYDLSEVNLYWQDIQQFHPFHEEFIYFTEQQRIKEALEEFEREIGRHFIYYNNQGLTSWQLNSQTPYQKLVKPVDWINEAWNGYNSSFDPFPDTDMAGLNLGSNPAQTGYWWEPKIWGWGSLGRPGDNSGRINPRQIGYVMSYWLPRAGLQTVLWDVDVERLVSSTNLEYYQPFAPIYARMRYLGDWLGIWTRIPNTTVYWSLHGKKGTSLQTSFPILLWFSNADFNRTTGYSSSPATVNFNFNLTAYGLSGPWYAFDVATMSLVGSGSDASNVTLTFNIPAWEWRPIYIFSGTYNPNEQKLLYSSSKPLSEATQGSNLSLRLDGHSGMYYKLAIQTTQPPQGIRKDATAFLPQLANREAVLNTVAVEGWYYDSQRNILLVSYKGSI